MTKTFSGARGGEEVKNYPHKLPKDIKLEIIKACLEGWEYSLTVDEHDPLVVLKDYIAGTAWINSHPIRIRVIENDPELGSGYISIDWLDVHPPDDKEDDDAPT